MRQLLTWLALFLTVQSSFAATITSKSGQGTVDGTLGASWVGNVAPGSSDVAKLADGTNVHIPSGQTVSWQSFSNTTSSGTGTITIDGTLNITANSTYAQNLPGSGHLKLNTGAITVLPSQVGADITMTGVAGTHASIDGFSSGSPTGQLNVTVNAAYLDFNNIGASGNYAFFPVLGAGANFICHFCGFDYTASMGLWNMAGNANIDIENSVFTNNTGSSGIQIQMYNVSAKTGGTRKFTNNYWEGWLYWDAASFGLDIGLIFQGNFCYSSSAGSIACIENASNPPSFSGTNFSDNIVSVYIPSSTGFQGSILPSGTVNRLYSLYASWMDPTGCAPSSSPTINYHPLFTSNSSVNIDQIIMEVDCGGANGASDGIQVSDTSFPTTVNITNSISLPGKDGVSASVFSSSYHSLTAAVISGNHNTFHATASTGACGFGTDNDSGNPANQFGDIKCNIFYRPASGAGCASGTPTTPPTGIYSGTIGYNVLFNITGSPYHGSAGAYSTTPGTGDQTGDPQFVDSTRNFLKWCQTLDGTITTWDQCRAKFISQTAGFTPSALIDYIQAGFKPAASFVATACNDGSYAGAVSPASPVSPTQTVSGASLKGVRIQ